MATTTSSAVWAADSSDWLPPSTSAAGATAARQQQNMLDLDAVETALSEALLLRPLQLDSDDDRDSDVTHSDELLSSRALWASPVFTSVSTSNGLKTRGRSCSSGAALLTSTSSGGYGGGLSPSPIAAETSSSSAAAALPPSVTIPRQVKGLFAGPYQLLKPECLTRWKAYCEATDKVVAIQLLPPGPNAMELAREMLTATPDASGTRVVDCGRCEVLGPFAVYATGSGSPHTNLSTPVPMPQPPAATASVASPSPPTVFYVNTPLTRAASTLRHTPSPTSTPPRNRAWAPTSPPESPPSANGSNSNSGNTSSGASVCSSGDALTPMSCSISSAATTPSSTPCPIQTDAGATEETFAPRAMCKFSLRQEPCRTVNCRFLHYPGLKPTTDEELAALPPLRRPAPGYICHNCGSDEHFKQDCPQPQRCRYTQQGQICQRPHCAFYHPPGLRQPPKHQPHARPSAGYVCHSCGDTTQSHFRSQCPLMMNTALQQQQLQQQKEEVEHC